MYVPSEDMKLNSICDSDLSYMMFFFLLCLKCQVVSSDSVKKTCNFKHSIMKHHSQSEADNYSDIGLEVADFADDLMSI